jgi:hypothetical protein
MEEAQKPLMSKATLTLTIQPEFVHIYEISGRRLPISEEYFNIQIPAVLKENDVLVASSSVLVSPKTTCVASVPAATNS